MKYAVEMGSDAVIYTKFHKDLFRNSKVDTVHSQAHRQNSDRISPLLSFYNKGSWLKIKESLQNNTANALSCKIGLDYITLKTKTIFAEYRTKTYSVRQIKPV
jgi:hypothetical protein